MSPRRNFSRRIETRDYRTLFLIAAEGQTEVDYFNCLRKLLPREMVPEVECIKGDKKKPDPKSVLAKMKRRLRSVPAGTPFQAWLVIDKDEWGEEILNELHHWTLQDEGNRGLAVSNPKFEYWLLLHFEDGRDITSSKSCSYFLKRHLKDYDKHINDRIITPALVAKAIERARNRDNPPCADWPRAAGRTTVYRLVERLLP